MSQRPRVHAITISYCQYVVSHLLSVLSSSDCHECHHLCWNFCHQSDHMWFFCYYLFCHCFCHIANCSMWGNNQGSIYVGMLFLWTILWCIVQCDLQSGRKCNWSKTDNSQSNCVLEMLTVSYSIFVELFTWKSSHFQNLSKMSSWITFKPLFVLCILYNRNSCFILQWLRNRMITLYCIILPAIPSPNCPVASQLSRWGYLYPTQWWLMYILITCAPLEQKRCPGCPHYKHAHTVRTVHLYMVCT